MLSDRPDMTTRAVDSASTAKCTPIHRALTAPGRCTPSRCWTGVSVNHADGGAVLTIMISACSTPSPHSRPPQPGRAAACPGCSRPDRVQRWQRAIGYLARKLPIVRAAGLGGITSSAWNTAAARLMAAVPRLLDDQIIVGMAQLVAMLHDDETLVIYPARPVLQFDAQPFAGRSPSEQASAPRMSLSQIPPSAWPRRGKRQAVGKALGTMPANSQSVSHAMEQRLDGGRIRSCGPPAERDAPWM